MNLTYFTPIEKVLNIMATTTAISGQPQKNNGGTVLQAGNTDSSVVIDLSLSSNASTTPNGSKVIQSATSNIGTMKPISGGNFANTMTSGKFIVRGLTGQSIAGVALSGIGNIKIAAEQNGNYSIKRWSQYERLHITSWDYVTGAATKGGSAGDATYFAAVDGSTVNSNALSKAADDAANPTKAVPGELVYMTTGVLPTQDEYEAR